ncbi:hypothetical protein PINS_up002714 [Pythium insidiosum]|nr:hypothetical protein PINS_up002714 [Pythium insidiosum]
MDERERDELYEAAETGNVERVASLLDEGADINAAAGFTGYTPLLGAAWRGHVDVVRMLLDRGADAQVQDRLGSTPLHGAASVGDVDVLRMLLDPGAHDRVQDAVRQCVCDATKGYAYAYA